MSTIKLRRFLYAVAGLLAAAGFLVTFGAQPATPGSGDHTEHADSKFPTNLNLNTNPPPEGTPSNEHLHKTAWQCIRTSGCKIKGKRVGQTTREFSCIPQRGDEWDGECAHS